MIEYRKGNIFDSKWNVLVNTINTQGVMGKGLAAETKKRFPEIMPSYKLACKNGLKGGDIQVYFTGNQYIVNFATKEKWQNPSEYEWIQRGLCNLYKYLKSITINNSNIIVAMPIVRMWSWWT